MKNCVDVVKYEVIGNQLKRRNNYHIQKNLSQTQSHARNWILRFIFPY